MGVITRSIFTCDNTASNYMMDVWLGIAMRRLVLESRPTLSEGALLMLYSVQNT